MEYRKLNNQEKLNNISQSEAEDKVTKVANYLVDEKAQRNTVVMTKKARDLGYIGVNSINEEEFDSIESILKETSKGKVIVDKYDNSMNTQAMYSTTKKQFENPDYDIDKSEGLGYGDIVLFPTAKVGVTAAKVTKEVTPVIARKTGQAYDDATLKMTGVVEKVAPTVASPQNAKKAKDFLDGFQADGVKLPIMKNKAHNTGYGTRAIIEELGN